MFRRVMAADGHMLYPARPAKQQALDQRHQKEQRHERAIAQCDQEGDDAVRNLRRARPSKHAENHRWIVAKIKPCNDARTPIRQEAVDHPRYDPANAIKCQKPRRVTGSTIMDIRTGWKERVHPVTVRTARCASAAASAKMSATVTRGLT